MQLAAQLLCKGGRVVHAAQRLCKVSYTFQHRLGRGQEERICFGWLASCNTVSCQP
jgi:hypothetical protein